MPSSRGFLDLLGLADRVSFYSSPRLHISPIVLHRDTTNPKSRGMDWGIAEIKYLPPLN